VATASQAPSKRGCLKDTKTPHKARREGVCPVFRDEAGRSAGTGGRPSEAGRVLTNAVASSLDSFAEDIYALTN